jgi:cystathionine beta-lyase
VEATCLAWIDARATGLASPQRSFEAAGLGLSDGRDFGPAGLHDGFVRLNFGCSRALLDQALDRLRAALPR